MKTTEVLLAINNFTGKRCLLDGDIINRFVMPQTISLFSALEVEIFAVSVALPGCSDSVVDLNLAMGRVW